MDDRLVRRATAVFMEIFGTAPLYGASTRAADLETWDSLNHVRLVHALEQEFGCLVPEDVLIEPTTFGDLLAALERAE